MVPQKLMMAVGLAALCVFTGCGTLVTDGDRELIDQDIKAAALIANSADKPEVIQAAADITKNSEVLQAGLGKPKVQQPYNPAVSELARYKATQQHQEPWWKMILTSVAGLFLGGGAARLLTAFVPGLMAGRVGVALNAVVEGVARFRQTAAQNPGRQFSVDDLLTVLASLQDQAGVRDLVRSYASKIESKLSSGTTARLPVPPPPTAGTPGTGS